MKEKGYEIEILDVEKSEQVLKYFMSKYKIFCWNEYGSKKLNMNNLNYYYNNLETYGQKLIFIFIKKRFTFKTYDFYLYQYHSLKSKNNLKKYTSKDILNLIRLDKLKRII